MTEKIGLIKNPLTIIAIFAGIAEVSGTIVLPFIAQSNQELFIYFLILFPSILVTLFFITLNFNNKVLYAPSDYKDETNYIKINKYDVSKQKTIEVKVPKSDSKNPELIQLMDRIDYLNNHILRLETMSKKDNPSNEEELYYETIGYEFLVSNFENANAFIGSMKKFGIDFSVYHSPGANEDIFDYPAHRAIWLGKNVNLEVAQLVIRQSKEFFPHLKYIQLSGEQFKEHEQVYIGGSTDAAVRRFQRIALKDSDFQKLDTFTDLNSFHNFIKQFGD